MTGLAACPTEVLRALKGFTGPCLLRASCRAPTLLMPPTCCQTGPFGQSNLRFATPSFSHVVHARVVLSTLVGFVDFSSTGVKPSPNLLP